MSQISTAQGATPLKRRGRRAVERKRVKFTLPCDICRFPLLESDMGCPRCAGWRWNAR